MKNKRRKPATVPLLYAIQPHLLNMGRRLAYRQAATTGELVEGVPTIRKGTYHQVPTSALERVLGIELDVDDYEWWQAEREAEQAECRRTKAAS